MTNMGELTDQELLAGVQASFGEERRWIARVIAYLAEIDRRKLHVEAACSSLFDFCRHRLGMSDGEAFRRMTAARLVQQFPTVLDALGRGEVHLSALVLLRDHLTEGNHEELLREASGKTKQQVAAMLAARFPRPDVPSRIVELMPSTAAQEALALRTAEPEQPSPGGAEVAPPRARVEPLSSARYRVALTASSELRDKLTRAQDLMRHRNPSGDLSVIVEQALDLLLTKLEKERLGKTTLPREANGAHTVVSEKTATRRGYIRRSVRRAVYERDGEQCTFVDEEGRRCPSRGFLELDHVVSKAHGGSDEADNLRVRCRVHNRHHAEQVFGRAHVERQIHLRQRKRAAPDDPPFETAARGLRNLGFREVEIQRALTAVRAKVDPSACTETLLREALALLT